jgi:hypothetical protein
MAIFHSTLVSDNVPHVFALQPMFRNCKKERTPIEQEIEKITGTYCTEAKPLKRLYTIADSTVVNGEAKVLIERLSSQESFIALVKCAFRLDTTDHHMLRRQFHFLERAVSRVSVRRLTFPRDFNFLPAVQEAIVNDLKDLDN